MSAPASVPARHIRTIRLENGLDLIVTDRTRHYFGGYLVVRLELACEVPLEERFIPAELCRQASARLRRVVFTRVLEKMGVLAADAGGVAERLLADFLSNSGRYLSSPAFPEKLVRRELEKARR
ncbi:MAG TPA: hypothetical protein VNX25_03980 [Verrucomicrobiae bacterium]|nr:hypothetical protein [Verrucomicrobiae bacterium]